MKIIPKIGVSSAEISVMAVVQFFCPHTAPTRTKSKNLGLT